MHDTQVLAVDIGRSTVRSAVLEREGEMWTIREVERLPTISLAGDLTASLLSLLRRRLEVERQVDGIGIATAGQVSPLGVVSSAFTNLYHEETPLAGWLTESLQVSVVVRNDVQLMALAEAVYGAGRGWPIVFGVAIGSGVGGGIVRHGRLDIGSGGIAGEIGHLRAVDRGERRSCWCGGKGCLEVQVSGLAIEERYHHMTGVKTQATEILRSVPADRPAARLARKVVRELATGLETLACCVSPDGIVLGGSVGVALAPFLPSLQEQIAQHAYLAVRAMKLRVAELGVDAELYGAAALWERASDNPAI